METRQNMQKIGYLLILLDLIPSYLFESKQTGLREELCKYTN